MCVCVCVCVCACAALSKTDRQITVWASGASKRQIHTKYVQMAGYESIHLNIVYVLSEQEQLGENPMRVNILS